MAPNRCICGRPEVIGVDFDRDTHARRIADDADARAHAEDLWPPRQYSPTPTDSDKIHNSLNTNRRRRLLGVRSRKAARGRESGGRWRDDVAAAVIGERVRAAAPRQQAATLVLYQHLCLASPVHWWTRPTTATAASRSHV